MNASMNSLPAHVVAALSGMYRSINVAPIKATPLSIVIAPATIDAPAIVVAIPVIAPIIEPESVQALEVVSVEPVAVAVKAKRLRKAKSSVSDKAISILVNNSESFETMLQDSCNALECHETEQDLSNLDSDSIESLSFAVTSIDLL